MPLYCERCKKEVYKREQCNYCMRKICLSCEKSSQRVKKLTRLVICKDCWGKIEKRKVFKNRGQQPSLLTET
jgi:hypothetical protein